MKVNVQYNIINKLPKEMLEKISLIKQLLFTFQCLHHVTALPYHSKKHGKNVQCSECSLYLEPKQQHKARCDLASLKNSNIDQLFNRIVRIEIFVKEFM